MNVSSAVQELYSRNSAGAWNQINWRLCYTSNSQSNTMVIGLYLRLKEQMGDENADIRVDKFDLDSSDDE